MPRQSLPRAWLNEMALRSEGLAGGIEQGGPQRCRRQLARGEEATLGATAARCQPVRQRRTTRESPESRPTPPSTAILPIAFPEKFVLFSGGEDVAHIDAEIGAADIDLLSLKANWPGWFLPFDEHFGDGNDGALKCAADVQRSAVFAAPFKAHAGAQ